jgi:hypothetical protein
MWENVTSWECSMDGKKTIAYRSFLRKHIGNAQWGKKTKKMGG